MPTHLERRDSSSTGSQIASAVAGGVAGFAVGLLLAQTFGGLSGLRARFRRVVDEVAAFDPAAEGAEEDEASDEIVDEWESDGVDEALGERVLEAFRNDPTLAERAIDIEAAPGATIELFGEVDGPHEVEYAATLAGGVPGVEHVIAHLGVKGQQRRTRA
ncbi:MAG: BON domain-containing protein [Gemmatimonadota bacterium]|nr:BON domain-containing protein [Gemmatimonadota bacterium]